MTTNLKYGVLGDKLSFLRSIATADNDKLNYAIKKVTANISSAMKALSDKYQENVQDLQLKYASVYPAGYTDISLIGCVIVNSKNQYCYSKESQIALNQEIRVLSAALNDSDISVEPFFADETWPRVAATDLFIRDQLTGLLFAPATPADQNTAAAKLSVVQPDADLAPTAIETGTSDLMYTDPNDQHISGADNASQVADSPPVS